MEKDVLQLFGERIGYKEAELEKFKEGGHRIRHVRRLSQAAKIYTIEAEIVKSNNCNSGYKVGDKLIMDVDGNLISKLCPKRMCVYLISQLPYLWH
ncbi:MAG: hypothetical protein AB1502_01260 [Thermodesulfobacteriota bacterium]